MFVYNFRRTSMNVTWRKERYENKVKDKPTWGDEKQ